MASCIKCEERKKQTLLEVTTFTKTRDGPTWSTQADGSGITFEKYMPVEDVKRFETTFYEKLNAAHLRNVPKGLLTDLQARTHGGKNPKTADLLLHILWNPMNRQKLISGCTHQYEDLSGLIDELVTLYGPRSDKRG